MLVVGQLQGASQQYPYYCIIQLKRKHPSPYILYIIITIVLLLLLLLLLLLIIITIIYIYKSYNAQGSVWARTCKYMGVHFQFCIDIEP